MEEFFLLLFTFLLEFLGTRGGLVDAAGKSRSGLREQSDHPAMGLVGAKVKP